MRAQDWKKGDRAMSILRIVLPEGSSPTRICSFFVGLIMVLAVLSGMLQLLWRQWRISAAPVSTIGLVTALDCPNHGHVDYSFAVDRHSDGARQFFVDGIDCRSLKIGQRIAIVYERAARENNFALYPIEGESNRARSAFLTGLAFISVLIFMLPLFPSAL
jgi:hypothetical protein